MIMLITFDLNINMSNGKCCMIASREYVAEVSAMERMVFTNSDGCDWCCAGKTGFRIVVLCGGPPNVLHCEWRGRCDGALEWH